MEAFSSEVVPPLGPLGGTWPALATRPAGTRTVRQSGAISHSHVASSKTTALSASPKLLSPKHRKHPRSAAAAAATATTATVTDVGHVPASSGRRRQRNALGRQSSAGGNKGSRARPLLKNWVPDYGKGCAALFDDDAIERRRRHGAGRCAVAPTSATCCLLVLCSAYVCSLINDHVFDYFITYQIWSPTDILYFHNTQTT